MTAGKASAQGSNNGNPTILQAVQNLQGSVNALQSTVNNIQTDVAALTASEQSNVRVTPGLFLEPNQSLLFSVTNVGSVPHKIKVERVDRLGNIDVIISGETLQPSHSTDGNVGTVSFVGSYYLKFTVLDGSRADIRASAQQLLGPDVLGAALAAE
jgi:hypothetical protein